MDTISTIQIVSGIIGSVGGILGFWTFIDNFILKFNPKFKIANILFFQSIPYGKQDALYTSSIFVKVDIINTRNKVGKIDDFALRIYDDNSTSPNSDMFFATYKLGNVFSPNIILDNSLKELFASIPMPNKSIISQVVEFQPETCSRPYIKGKSLKVDLIYYGVASGWKLIKTFSLYCHNTIEKKRNDTIVEYSIMDIMTIRGKVKHSIKKPKTAFYKGLTDKYLGIYIRQPWYFIKAKFLYPVKVGKLLVDVTKIATLCVWSKCIMLPIIISKSRKIPRLNIICGRQHLVNDTNKALQIMYKNIKSILKKFNDKCESDAKITISSFEEEVNNFIVSRGNLSVKFYKSGDGHIHIQEYYGYSSATVQNPLFKDIHNSPNNKALQRKVNTQGKCGNRIKFSMEIIEYPLGIRLWKIEGKVMSLRTACIYIIDYVCLLAH
jgi:hypothetical protein